MRFFRGFFISIIIIILAVGCGKQEEEEVIEPIEEEIEEGPPPPELSDTAKGLETGTKVAVIETEKGVIEIELYDDTPITTENFIEIVEDGFYNGLTFHRKVKDQLIQTGATNPDGTGSSHYIEAEDSSHKHIAGAIAMAKLPGDERQSGCQFYICLKSLPSLDGQYTVFGGLVTGLDIAKSIIVGDVVERVSIVEVGGEE